MGGSLLLNIRSWNELGGMDLKDNPVPTPVMDGDTSHHSGAFPYVAEGTPSPSSSFSIILG